MRTLIERRFEWGLPTFIAKLDIKKAYDTVAWCALDWLIQRRQLPHHLQCAYWRMRHSRVLHLNTAGGADTFSITPAGGMQQGAPDSPLIYAALVEELLDVASAHLVVNELPAGSAIDTSEETASQVELA